MIGRVSESEEHRGSLADAIAAHLELKKEHGADADEVEREKQAALGKVRREIDDSDDVSAAGSPEPAAAEPSERALDPESAVEPSDPTEPASTGETFEFDWSPQQPERAGEPDPGAAAPAGDDQPADDVLEETPDFFEETPEYDRLWFEEKPPNNFDF